MESAPPLGVLELRPHQLLHPHRLLRPIPGTAPDPPPDPQNPGERHHTARGDSPPDYEVKIEDYTTQPDSYNEPYYMDAPVLLVPPPSGQISIREVFDDSDDRRARPRNDDQAATATPSSLSPALKLEKKGTKGPAVMARG